MRRILRRCVRALFGMAVAICLVGALLALVSFSLTGIDWATRPVQGSGPAPADSATPSATRVTASATAPSLVSRAAQWAAATVAEATGNTPQPTSLGGEVPGACTQAGIPVTVSSRGTDAIRGVHVIVGVSPAGMGAKAYSSALASVTQCPEATSVPDPATTGSMTVVSAADGRTWYVARYLDIVAVVATADTRAKDSARDTALVILSKAVSASGCAEGTDSASPYEKDYSYPVAESQVSLADIGTTQWLPTGEDYLTPGEAPVPDPSPTSSPEVPSEPAVGRPIVTLAPLLTREQGGNGLVRGPAPVLVDPQDIPIPMQPMPAAAPQDEPVLGSLPLTASLLRPHDDMTGPGCGWGFLGTVMPDAPSPMAVRDALLAGYAQAALDQTLALEDISRYPSLLAQYTQDLEAQAAWDAYEDAVAEAETAWQEAERAYLKAEEYWRTPTAVPSPTPSPGTETPAPVPSPSPTSGPTVTPTVTPAPTTSPTPSAAASGTSPDSRLVQP